MQRKLAKQRISVRDLEQKLAKCRTDNTVLHTMVSDRERVIEQYRGTLEGLRAEVREFSDNNAKQAGRIARLEQEAKQERGRASDAERELRGLETKLNSAHMILRDMAVLIIAYSEGHTWDDDAKDMVNQYSTCDWMQKAHKDFERCTADGITPALRDVPERKIEHRCGDPRNGAPELQATEGRPFGRNEHEAEEYVPPKVPIAGLMERVATLESDHALLEERFDVIAHSGLTARVHRIEQDIATLVDAHNQQVQGNARVLERFKDLEDNAHTPDDTEGLMERVAKLEQAHQNLNACIDAIREDMAEGKRQFDTHTHHGPKHD
jgi:chromosome segregation ATPase